MSETIAAHGGQLVDLAAGRRVADANQGMLTLLRSLLYFHPWKVKHEGFH